jgi:hypothetical protein
MTSNKFKKWESAAAFAVALVGLTLHGAVQAQDCKTNTDCPKGLECDVVGSSGCAGASTPACEPGKDCPTPAPVDAGACQTQEIKACSWATCTKDTDCGDGMVCHTSTNSVCTDTAPVTCTKGEPCPAPPPSNCTTTMEQRCTPRYLLPCKVSADCGDGFDCVAPTCGCGGASTGTGSSGSSSGSSGSGSGSGASDKPLPAVDAGAPPEAVDAAVDCGCPPASEMYCQAKTITCDTAKQCPTSWTCDAYSTGGTGVACAVTAPAPGQDAGPTAFTCPDAGPAVAPTTQKQCTPPYASLAGGVGRGLAADGSAVGQGTGTTDHYNGGTAAPTAANADAGAKSAGSSSSRKSSTCSVTRLGEHGSDHGALALGALGLAGLFVTHRRRVARGTARS